MAYVKKGQPPQCSRVNLPTISKRNSLRSALCWKIEWTGKQYLVVVVRKQTWYQPLLPATLALHYQSLDKATASTSFQFFFIFSKHKNSIFHLKWFIVDSHTLFNSELLILSNTCRLLKHSYTFIIYLCFIAAVVELRVLTLFF